VFVDSGNPVLTGADSRAYRRAFGKLELLLVVDVAMTETARLAHYVLPASSQYEKPEATFFNFEFPNNFFHLRKPLFEPLEGTLPEAEIYRRLVVAMEKIPEDMEELEEAAVEERENPGKFIFAQALQKATAEHPELKPYAPLVLYNTLGKALPEGTASAALLWYSCQMFAGKNAAEVAAAGIEDAGSGLGDALFNRILESDTGVVISSGKYENLMDSIRHKDGKIHLAIPEMLDEITALEEVPDDTAYPFILQAGERRSYNANQIFRSGDWRKQDLQGYLKVHPKDAEMLGVSTDDEVEVESVGGKVTATVLVTDEVRRGMVSMPHGYGMLERQSEDWSDVKQIGPNVNDLTDSKHCDEISMTPFHKFVPVRIAALATA
jgi:anaerobic selenocysteine-containing dehydrogenase